MARPYAIFVTMQLKPGTGDAFRPHILKNAEATRSTEDGNHQFTVLVSEDDPDRYHFFEVYADKAALEAHRRTAHFQAYAEATKDMVLERSVQTCHLEDQ